MLVKIHPIFLIYSCEDTDFLSKASQAGRQRVVIDCLSIDVLLIYLWAFTSTRSLVFLIAERGRKVTYKLIPKILERVEVATEWGHLSM